MDCLTSEEIKSLPTQAFDAIKSYVPITQTMVLSVKGCYKPKSKKVEGSTVKGKTRIEKYKTGSFAHVIDPQNLSECLRCYHVPTKILPRTASLLSTEANVLREEFYKKTLLNGDAHGKLNSAIKQLYKHSEENGVQDKFSILPEGMVKNTFIPDAPSESEVDVDEEPHVPPKDRWNAEYEYIGAAFEATQALIDARTATTADTNSDRDGDDNGGADGDDNDKSPVNETVIATTLVPPNGPRSNDTLGAALSQIYQK
jgi:hypothetical protein